jgi:uncharacterized protein (DUF433 family)
MRQDLLGRITINVEICKGKPAIRGMRFTVSQMLDLIASGMTFDEILTDYTYIEYEDILACLHYASVMMNSKDVILFEKVA